MVRGNHQERYQFVNKVINDLDNLSDLPIVSKETEKIAVNKHEINNSIITDQNNKNKLLAISLGLGTTIIGIASIFLVFKIFAVEKYLPYTNYNYRIEVEYPEHWSVQESEDIPYPGIIFLTPQENDQDNFQEQVKISGEKLSRILSLEEYTEQATKEIASSNIIMEKPKKITLANREGRKIIYQDTEAMQSLEVWTIKNQQVYIVIYTTESDKFKKFSKQAEQIIDSLEIR